MIATKDTSPQLTPEEYFAWEEKQLEKHEYIDGEGNYSGLILYVD